MKSLSFYEQQHLQRLFQQEGQVKYLFDNFVRRVSPLLAKWSNHGGDRVWIKNARVENAIDKELSGLHASLLSFITDATIQSWNRGNRKADDLVRSYIEGMSVSEALQNKMFSRNADALNALLRRKDNNGFTVSERVWNVTGGMKDNLEYYLSSGVSVGRPAALISQDVRQLLNEPDRRFRRVRNEEGKLTMSKPMKDYHPGQGVYRSAYKNALRLTATQTNIGYRQADSDRWQRMDFVLGIEIKRSASNHGPCKICDAMVGKYPKGFVFTGFHPFCICYATPIMMNQEEFADFLLDERIPEGKIITSLPAGAEKFIRDNEEQLSRTKPYWYKDNFIGNTSFPLSASVADSIQGNSFKDLLNRAKQLGITTKRFEDTVAKDDRHTDMVMASIESEIKRTEINLEKERQLYLSVVAKENEIRMNKAYETAISFNKDGEVVLNKDGQSRHVAFTAEECRKLKNTIMTHNHPSGWAYPENSVRRIGNSFSEDDILMAVRCDLAEMRAVTPNYTFVLKRPKKGWGVTLEDFHQVYKSVNKLIREEGDAYVDKMGSSESSCDRAGIVHFHKVNKRLAKRFGWEYSKRRG